MVLFSVPVGSVIALAEGGKTRNELLSGNQASATGKKWSAFLVLGKL